MQRRPKLFFSGEMIDYDEGTEWWEESRAGLAHLGQDFSFKLLVEDAMVFPFEV